MGANVLLFDVGNTSTKIGLAGSEGILAATSTPTNDEACAGWAVTARELLARAGVAGVGGVAASSVVPAKDSMIRDAAKALGVEARFVPGDLPLSIENRYAKPEEVGADRLTGAYAARRLHPDAERIVVVDFGTATTFDCIAGNAYLGGLICPGVISSVKSLWQETAKLPEATLEIDTQGVHVGRSTLDSLNQGLVYGFGAMVEGLTARLAQELGGAVLVLATGGFAEKIASVCPAIAEVRADLLMEGLRLAWYE